VTDRDGPSGRSVRVVTAGRDIDDALAIRRQVFIVEQHVPEELEYDGLDAGATHYLCSLDGRAIGTARVRCTDGTAKIERVAVLADHRRDGVGRHLMEVVLSDLRHQEVTTIALASQTYAQDFYRGLGFVPVGDEFEDAGIPHISMVLRVRD
jgi:predicted GNAT family N-acyltransferase